MTCCSPTWRESTSRSPVPRHDAQKSSRHCTACLVLSMPLDCAIDLFGSARISVYHRSFGRPQALPEATNLRPRFGGKRVWRSSSPITTCSKPSTLRTGKARAYSAHVSLRAPNFGDSSEKLKPARKSPLLSKSTVMLEVLLSRCGLYSKSVEPAPRPRSFRLSKRCLQIHVTTLVDDSVSWIKRRGGHRRERPPERRPGGRRGVPKRPGLQEQCS